MITRCGCRDTYLVPEVDRNVQVVWRALAVLGTVVKDLDLVEPVGRNVKNVTGLDDRLEALKRRTNRSWGLRNNQVYV